MSVKYQDYREASKRLRLIEEGHDPISVYGCDSENEVNADKVLIYDAEHDTELATVEWLKSIGIAFISLPESDLKRAFAGTVEIFDYRHVVIAKTIGWHSVNPTRGELLKAVWLFDKKRGSA